MVVPFEALFLGNSASQDFDISCVILVEVLRRSAEAVIFPCKQPTSIAEIRRDDEFAPKTAQKDAKVLAREIP